jgi:hypothetical protein
VTDQTQPFPTNPVTTTVNQAIDGVFGVAVKAAETSLIALNPAIFGNPILETIDDKIIELVANAIYQQFALWVSFEIIDFTDAHQVSSEQKALIALKAAQASGDKNALIQALADFDKSVEALTHFNGAGGT